MQQLKVRVPQTSGNGHCPYFSEHLPKSAVCVYEYSHLSKHKPEPISHMDPLRASPSKHLWDFCLPRPACCRGQCTAPLVNFTVLPSSRTLSGLESCHGHNATAGICVSLPSSTRVRLLWNIVSIPGGSLWDEGDNRGHSPGSKTFRSKGCVHPVWYNPQCTQCLSLRAASRS